MVPFHNVSAFFFISHLSIERSAAMLAWEVVNHIRFSFSETACVKSGTPASPFCSNQNRYFIPSDRREAIREKGLGIHI